MQELPSAFQQYIHLSRYARWDKDKGRRETWEETVTRYFDFFDGYLSEKHDFDFGVVSSDLYDAVINLEVMPSMRCLMTAGKALARDHVAGYNCSYRMIDDPRAFDEILFILMCGTGVGFSVERQYVNKLPKVPESFDETTTTIKVRDSKRGWGEGYRELIAMLYAGRS
jgi:ribonucleoside-diphosphate reductase alpha chain